MIRTACELREALRPHGLGIDGDTLALETQPPAELLAMLRVLHTGIRANLKGCRWYGDNGDARRVRLYRLNPREPIPADVRLLAVAGECGWDRIHPAAKQDWPALFEGQ